MGKLHDRLEEIGYRDHKLEVYLVRILFCLFAEDTTIFNKQIGFRAVTVSIYGIATTGEPSGGIVGGD